MDIEPDWVHLDTDENGVTMNRYFVEHPEMVLGEIKMESTRFGTFEPVCKARKDIPLSELLSNAVQRINGEIPELDNGVDEISDEQELSVHADLNVRNFSFTLVDGRVYFRENERMHPASVSMTAENRIKGLIQIRDCVRKLIEYQTEDYPEEMICTEQENLNRLYDVYTAKYGLINSRGNYLAFASDESYFLLCSLEVLDDEGNFKRKADMFTKRTIKPHREVTSVETASEALALSIGEKARVDLPYMEQLTGKTQVELVQDLQGVIFKVPNCEPVSYAAADEYLSGNVRNKLTVAELAAKNDPELAVNVDALKKVIPKDLSAAEISVRLGATWIPQDDIQRFVMELLTPSSYAAGRLKVRYTPINGDWFIENKSSDMGNVKADSTYGTKRASAYRIIVYYNGRTKAIAAARDFADSPGVNDKNDPELDSLSQDIMQEVHGDYYLAGMIKKGVAYHIGYLPASIRTRIEELFQKGNITTMFCTSTLLEGVNLPADNLFITDNKIFRRKMNPVDFRNLIGRVGRISYNLYGNVFFVSEDRSVAAESYIDMLQAPVPEQELSITTNPDVLKKIEKKYIADILKTGSSEIPRRRDDQSDESYVMMRKFGLILLRDIMEERDSLVHREFADFLTVEDEAAIREKFKESPTLPDDDINTSVDQTKKLIIAIKQGLTYPPCNGGFVYADVIEFFNKLSDIFDWPIYEKSTLGSESKRKWYAVILCQWMEGSGLSYIMKRAIEYHKTHPDNFRVSAYQPPTTYNDRSKEHRNVVFADTLEVIENVILFSISNYFLRFSNEYKKVHDVTEFDNNWYEYVEFGTTNPLTILLQRNGFSRESATYIRNHKDEYVVHDGSGGELKLKSSLLICGNTSVMTEAASIKFNVPGLFLEEDA